MKHVLVFFVIGVAVYFLAIKKSDLDVLMVPMANYTEAQVGNRFVSLEPSQLPTTPKRLAEPGVVTVVYFHDRECTGCATLDSNLSEFLKVRPDVAVRKVSMSPGSNGYTKAIRDYRWNIFSAPTILIFDRNTNLIAADEKLNNAGYDLLIEWISRELNRVANPKM